MESDLSGFFNIKDAKLAGSMTELPFQARVKFTKSDGSESLRVVSATLPTSSSRSQVESTSDVSTLSSLSCLFKHTYNIKSSLLHNLSSPPFSLPSRSRPFSLPPSLSPSSSSSSFSYSFDGRIGISDSPGRRAIQREGSKG